MGMVKSLRLDPALAARVRRAASARGITESQLMREAIEEKVRREPDEGLSFYERTHDLILPPIPDEEQVTDLDFGRIVQEKHDRIVERWRRRVARSRDATPG